MDFVFLDVETTGLDEHDEVIQLAYVVSRDGKKIPMNKLYKPKVPITFKAMAVHGIKREDVATAPDLSMDDVLMRGLTKLNVPENIIVAHNASFDLGMLERHGFENKMQVIDTLRCARHLLEEAEGHALGVLFYQYNLYLEMESLANELRIDVGSISAHDAMYDVLMLILLTRRLLTIAGGDPMKLVKLTQTPVMIKVFTFGKYKGELVSKIAKEDTSYLKWMIKGMEGLDEDMRFTINTHLGKLPL